MKRRGSEHNCAQKQISDFWERAWGYCFITKTAELEREDKNSQFTRTKLQLNACLREREKCHLPGLNLGLSSQSAELCHWLTGLGCGSEWHWHLDGRCLQISQLHRLDLVTATGRDSGPWVKSVAWKTWALLFSVEPDALSLYWYSITYKES